MSQNNALVEISLALAMAFFSIMVLAMVSMGVRPDPGIVSKLNLNNSSLNFIPSSEISEKSHKKAKRSKARKVKAEEMVIYYKNKFFDTSLNEISNLETRLDQIKYLAISPSITAVEVLKIQNRFFHKPIIVTLLNKIWLQTLKER